MRSIIPRIIAVAAVLGVVVAGSASAQIPGTARDRDEVKRAVLDYLEGFYEGDSTKLVRSVAPTVYKYGYARRGAAYTGMQMPYPQFMAFANGVKAGRNLPPKDAPRDIEIFDVQDQTASTKLTAWWGTDYLLLAKLDGKWMITHVIWQSGPPQ